MAVSLRRKDLAKVPKKDLVRVLAKDPAEIPAAKLLL
jgi:hypothetical protein